MQQMEVARVAAEDALEMVVSFPSLMLALII